MKKIMSTIMALIVALGLVACSSEQGGAQSSSEPVRAESSVVTAQEIEESAAEASEAVQESAAEESEAQGGKTLVVYYSAMGNTEEVAGYIAEATGADVLELEPVEPYSSEDLNYNDSGSRVVYEYENPDARNVELVVDSVDNWSEYDMIYIGYPVWWGIAAWPVNGFVKANDFTGKTVIPFCTSASSGLGESGELLAEMAGSGDWQEGVRFRSGVSREDVVAWVESLGL